MMKEGRKQSKFKHYMFAPLRVLNRARQLYMQGVVECAGGYGYGANVGVGGAVSPAVIHHIPRLPENIEGKVEFNETRLVVHRQKKQPYVGYKYNNRMNKMMSYSTEVRKIGRIDEDQPCYFEEDQIDVKTHLLYLYPRRRSNNVVNMRGVY